MKVLIYGNLPFQLTTDTIHKLGFTLPKLTDRLKYTRTLDQNDYGSVLSSYIIFRSWFESGSSDSGKHGTPGCSSHRGDFSNYRWRNSRRRLGCVHMIE